MQNNQSNPMKRFWKEKGYYILLGLCVVAVGVSGWLLVNGILQDSRNVQETLSIPATVEEPKPKAEQQPAKTPAASVPAEQPAEEAAAEAVLEAAAQQEWAVLPVSGSVLQDHAMDRLVYHATTRDWRVHNGVDLAAEPGQDVKAARAGTVTAVYEDEYYGTTVVIQHADGYTSHSCNLAQTTAVAAGDTVAAGDVIGTVGSTALLETASESHLHFEVYCNGEPVDPATFLY